MFTSFGMELAFASEFRRRITTPAIGQQRAIAALKATAED